MGWKQSESLPKRNEYVVGGLDGVKHIVINYNLDGSVIRTINGVDEYYATQQDFLAFCESNYQKYLESL